jgi:hypothetical protein
MSDCCNTIPRVKLSLSSPQQKCPQCHAKGKSVGIETVKAMLSVSLEVIQANSYYFCPTETCPVVYFATDHQQIFTEVELRERVHQKAPLADDVFVCYCFRHTPKSLRDEIGISGHSTAVQSINAGIRSGLCACDIRNPQGSCCLGNVKAVLHQVTDTTLSHSRS